jgi:hypothetical protein
VADVRHLRLDVELGEPVGALIHVGDRGELVAVPQVHVADVAQPVVDETERLGRHRRAHTTAAVVTADDHVLHLEDVDRVLEYRQAIDVGVLDDVGDVAMHEHLARCPPDDLVRGHAAVGAADPQEVWRLDVLEPAEELRVVGHGIGRPASIRGKALFEHVHARRCTRTA